MAAENIRLYLSGGSNRSALGSTGALMFLILNDQRGEYHWRDVDEVIGVSGGSQPIGAMIAGLGRSAPSGDFKDQFGKPITDDDYAHAMESLTGFYRAIASDGEHWKAARRRSLVLAIVALALLPLLVFGLSAFLPGLIAFPLGILSVPVVYRVGSWLLSQYLRDMLNGFMVGGDKDGANRSMVSLTNEAADWARPRSYFIGTAGLASGTNYFYWAGQGHSASLSGVSRSDSSPTDAVLASCSLPPLSQPGRPPVSYVDDGGSSADWPTKPEHAPASEALLDGGYGGNFGVQITQRVLEEIAADSTQPAADRRIIALDAGRRLQSGGSGIRVARMLSTVLRLIRVIEVSVNATYTNDIQDLEDVHGSVITVSRTNDAAAVARLSSDVHLMHKQLQRAIEVNALLGLTNLDAARAELGVIVGVVGIYLAEAQQRQLVGNSLPASQLELERILTAIGAAFQTTPATDLVARWDTVDSMYAAAVGAGDIDAPDKDASEGVDQEDSDAVA